MNAEKQKWIDALGKPSNNFLGGKARLIRTFSCEEFYAELYVQENDFLKYQRVMMLFPKELKEKAPAIAVPYYYPEVMMDFDIEKDKSLETYQDIAIMLHLVRRGYIVASADAYHLTYIESDKERDDFTRWQDAADELRHNNPNFTGMGKLVDDTKLLIDMLYNHELVDNSRIGIVGHSLGGKMAFYTGCLDDRICAILASDFGIGWDQTNWRSDWYWGNKVDEFIAEGIDHAQLLSAAAPKPFCLLAGKCDDEKSHQMMLGASGYENVKERLKFVNHATGHRPPLWALDEGYDFLDCWVKNKK